MGHSLEGAFGTSHDALDIDFPYFGTMVRVHPDLTDLALVQFLREAAEFTEKTPDKVVADVTDGIVRSTVHPDDFDAFWRIARQQRQTLDDLVTLAQNLIAAIAEVPTEQPSDSSDGLTPTESSSVVVSSSPVVARLEAQGRPDLALVVVQAQEFAASA